MATDPLSPDSKAFGPQDGPFTGVLMSGLVPGSTQNNDRPSGFMGTTGKLAFFGSKILEGMQRGKMLSYAAEEAKRTSTFKQALALADSQIQRSETPEQRKAAEKVRDNLVLSHLQGELEGDGKKGKDKKKNYDSSERPSSGGKPTQGQGSKKAVEGGFADHAKGFLSTLVNNLAGPDLPHSGPTDMNSLKAQLYDVQQMPGIEAKSKEISSQAAALVQNIKANKGTIEDLHADPGFANVMELATRYMGPQQAKQLQEQMAAGLPTPEQQQVREMNEYKLKLAKRNEEDEQRASELGARLDSIADSIYGGGSATAPPTGRPGANSTPVAGFTPVHKDPPEARPTPKEDQTPQQKVAEKFAPGDTSHLFGSMALPITPKYMEKYGKPAVAYVNRGNETMPLYSVPTSSGRRVLTDADYRVFREDQAQREGWSAPMTARPIRLANPEYKAMVNPRNKKEMIAMERDPNTGKWTAAKGPDGGPMVVKVEKDAATNARQLMTLGNNVVSTRFKELNAAKSAYDKKRLQMENNVGEYQNFSTDAKAKAAALASLEQKYQEQTQLINSQAKAHLGILGQAMRDSNMVDLWSEKETPEETPTSEPGTLFSLGDKPIGQEQEQ